MLRGRKAALHEPIYSMFVGDRHGVPVMRLAIGVMAGTRLVTASSEDTTRRLKKPGGVECIAKPS